MADIYNTMYNPDVLSCIANLSNDEVFTPPSVANAMLDLLPQELFSDPNTKFLDPACKSGVFLREIAKRLLIGLEPIYPDLQERTDHIFKNQLYGIAITELTSHLSRRSLYCSKTANGNYSVVKFDTVDGNVRFKRVEHVWGKETKDANGKSKATCVFCGASKDQYDRGDELESHAYEMIHTNKPEEIFKMKFDVIIGNPPYQLSDGGAQASAIPIYNKFVEQAKRLKPRYLCMIIPARWMTGGRGLDSFRKDMLNDKSISILHDFPNSNDCFTGVEIKGGVCYFLSDSHYSGKCSIYRHEKKETRFSKRYLIEEGDEIFVRDERLISIKEKVHVTDNNSFEKIVSSMRPYGLRGDAFANPQKYGLPTMFDTPRDGYLKVLGLESLKRKYKYLPPDYPLPINNPSLSKWKLFVTRNWGVGSYEDIPSNPVVAGPKELCTETFVEFGPFNSKTEVENVLSYLKTKFFRALVAIRKQDQGSSRAVYHYVPMQDFSKPWTDDELYAKYGLTDEEIAFIESMIKPME